MIPHPNSVGSTFTFNTQGVWSRSVLKRARKVEADVLFLMPTGSISVQSFSDVHVCRKGKRTVLGAIRDGQFDVISREIDTPSLLDLVKDLQRVYQTACSADGFGELWWR